MNLDRTCNTEHNNETPSTSRTSVVRRREKSETEGSLYEAHCDEEEWFSAQEDCTDEFRANEVKVYYTSLLPDTLENERGEIPLTEEKTDSSGEVVTEPSAPEPEPDEFEIAHAYQTTAFEFYQQNMLHEMQDDMLPHELDELHERSLKLAMELYKEQTKQLGEEAVEICQDTLLQTVEKCIQQLREIAQARMESLTAVMSEDMRIIYSEMISQSRQLFIETASMNHDIADLDQAYAIAIDYAINTFDLATNDMTECKSIPRRLLLSVNCIKSINKKRDVLRASIKNLRQPYDSQKNVVPCRVMRMSCLKNSNNLIKLGAFTGHF